MAFFPVMEHENVSSHKAHIGTLGKIFTCTCVLVHTSHMRVRCMHAYDCVDACTPVCPHPPFLVNWDGSVLKSNIPGQHCLPPSNGGNIRIWIFYCWNCHVSMNRLHTADWLINTSVYEMLDCNKRPWNAKFKMVETQALTLVWKYLNVSRCLYFSNKISVADKIVTKMAFILNVLSSSSALVFCRKRYKNRRTENFRIFFFFNPSRKRNPILRIIRNQNPIISQYFASTTR